jgi:GcrA cell cycle regulator
MFTCRWPEGDPKAADFHFCGRVKQRLDIPYCDHHAAIAFR